MAPQYHTRDGRAHHRSKSADEVYRGVDGRVVLYPVHFGDGGGEESVVASGVDTVEDDEGEEARAGGVDPEGEDCYAG